jgi:hypothetical protein
MEEEKQFKYIEIRKDKGNKVVKRLDVSGRRNHYIETVENGMNRNLNYLEYSTRIVSSEKELKII